ncbi:MAG: hypothetical protein OEO21_04630, partial [Candidatus Krumholzibacteria bacterium]|nr:hypothetical protein [Candidatus Krumholzibacteria bacterium]
MKRLAILTVALLVVLVATGRGLVPETISYQGVLTDGAGTPVADGSYAITFKIYTIASGGTEIWTETQTVNVAGGIFSVILGSLNPLGIPFDAKYWLGVAVDGGAEFTPRREMTATAYSLNARGVADSAITAGDIAGGTVVRSLNALTDDVTLAAGTNVSIATSGDSLIISASGGGSGGWSLTGNSGTDSGTNFLGTTDAEGLQLRVDNTTALRIEPGAVPSIIGGDATNTILSGPEGAVIAGGGNATDPNQVTDDYGVVGGGRGNTVGDEDADATTATDAVVGGGLLNQAMARGSVIGGGETNEASGEYSTIGGGLDNFTTAHAATVAGGDGNVASGLLASIAGGNANQAQGWESAVGGGGSNVASGYDATVPGGRENTAAGGYSLAAGRRAKALHGGSFVWADSTENADFSTLRPDQFLIRAAGGVGIGTNDPQQELEVAGSVRMAGFDLPTGAAAGYVLTSDAMGQGSWQPAPGGSAWGLAGNAGTNPVNDFVGTTDNVALELRVNNARAFTLLPHATSPNVVGGHSTNSVNANAWGQTVVGGGEAGGANQVTDTYGSVGGGVGNVAGNSDGSPTNASYATVAGGEGNTAFNEWAFVGGGMDNRAQGSYSVVSGGTGNTTL